MNIEEFFCDACHGEFRLTIDESDDISPADIKHCVFCGSTLDNDLNLPDDNFEEGWEEDIE